jgi:hypothetical protein
MSMKSVSSRVISIRRSILLSTFVSLFVFFSPAWTSVRTEVNQLQEFLKSHPKVATDLRANPNLVNNKRYLEKHDDLAKFLKRHPDAKRELVNHPNRVFGNYYRGTSEGLNHHH